MSKRILVGILFTFIFISFITLPRNPLQNDDASLYALAAKNAVVHNQWLAQFVSPGDQSSFLDKPPLGIWLLAWIPKLVGINELTIHIPNVIYFCLLLLVMYWGITRLASKKIALYSTLIAATSLGLVVYSRAPKLDILLPLFILTAHLSLYAFLKNNKPSSLVPLTLSLACGFLVKSGFGLIFPGLTILFLLIFNAKAREKLFKVRLAHFALLVTSLLLIIGAVLFAQKFALGDQWLPYLKSITIQSKYNTSYLGFGFYYSIIGFLLLILFPWTPLFLSTLNIKPFRITHYVLRITKPKLNLNSFCLLWFWSNFLFLLFFYRQSDLRTFTIFVPPLAILAGIRLIRMHWKPETERLGFQPARKPRSLFAGFRADIAWNLFFLSLFSVILIGLLIKPLNADGINISAAILPIGLFVIALAVLTFYYLKPSAKAWAVCFVFVALAYSVLFYNTKPLVESFNPDVKWPSMIKEYQANGYKFYIYRPPDRQLFFSPDLFYVDFMAGPADKYFWSSEEIKVSLTKEKAILLSDTKSLNKIQLKRMNILAADNYSSLVINK